MSHLAATQIPKPSDEQGFERASIVLWRGFLNDPNVQRNGRRDCLEIGGVRPQPLLAGADRWRGGISVRSRSRACHYRRRCEPEA